MAKCQVVNPFKGFKVGTTITVPDNLVFELQSDGYVKLITNETETNLDESKKVGRKIKKNERID